MNEYQAETLEIILKELQLIRKELQAIRSSKESIGSPVYIDVKKVAKIIHQAIRDIGEVSQGK